MLILLQSSSSQRQQYFTAKMSAPPGMSEEVCPRVRLRLVISANSEQFFHEIYRACLVDGGTPEDANDRFLWFLNELTSVGEAL
jgi:hypothetical protein